MENKEETKKFDGGYGLCPRCQQSSLIWGGDFTYEDYGMDGEGLVSNYTCPVCGSYLEVFTPYPEEPKKCIYHDYKGYSHSNYGELGEPTEFEDEFGERLHVGDLVIMVSIRNGDRNYSVVVKPDKYPEGIVMGIAPSCNQKTKVIDKQRWNVVKILDWSLVEDTPNVDKIFTNYNLIIAEEDEEI